MQCMLSNIRKAIAISFLISQPSWPQDSAILSREIRADGNTHTSREQQRPRFTGLVNLTGKLTENEDIVANWYVNHEHQFGLLLPITLPVSFPRDSRDGWTRILRIDSSTKDTIIEIGVMDETGDPLEVISGMHKHSLDRGYDVSEVERLNSDHGERYTFQSTRGAGDDIRLEQYWVTQTFGRLAVMKVESGTPFELDRAYGILATHTPVKDTRASIEQMTRHEQISPRNAFYPERRIEYFTLDGKTHGLARESTIEGNKLIMAYTSYYGEYVGEDLVFWPNGSLYQRAWNGYRGFMGPCAKFYDTGDLYSISEWVEGLMHGSIVTYYKDGSLATRTGVEKGKYIGQRKHYLPTGELIGITTFNNGEIIRENPLREVSPSEYIIMMNGNIDPGNVWSQR